MENHLSWTVAVARELTTKDSIWVVSNIRNASSHATLFVIREGILPRVVLSAGDDPPIERTLSLTRGLDNVDYQRWAIPWGSFHSFRLDVRTTLGSLSPGDYRLQFIWPKDGYVVLGLRDAKVVELKSLEVKFRVAATTIEEASERFHMYATDKYIMIVPKHQSIETIPTAPLIVSLTNKFDQPVHFRIVPPSGPAEGARVRAADSSLTVRKWSREAWYFPPIAPAKHVSPEERGKFPLHAVKPGQSVELASSYGWLAHGDGIYHYELEVQVGDAGSPGAFVARVYSEPFLVQVMHGQ